MNSLTEGIKSLSIRTSNIVSAVTKMMKMPYYQNITVTSDNSHNYAHHEDALADILRGDGFRQHNLREKLNKRNTMRWIKQPELAVNIPIGTFIRQPFGTQKNPDFIIKVSDKFVLFLEAKSSANNYYPTYNSGGVNPDYLYVFCSKKKNETTIFKGDSVITMEQQQLITNHIEEARQRDIELNNKLTEIDSNHRGIAYYTRPMIQQSGGASFTNHFTHSRRTETERKAIEWLTEMSSK